MDIKELRLKTGLSQDAFVRKLEPAMHKNHSALSKQILQKLEDGGYVTQHRMDAIMLSIQETFPNFSQTPIEIKPRKRAKWHHSHHIALFIFLVVTITVVGIYYYFDMKKVISETLALVASIAGVLALIFTIYKVTS